MVPLQNVSLTSPSTEESLITLLVKPINRRHFPAQASRRISKSKSFTLVKLIRPITTLPPALPDDTRGDGCGAEAGAATGPSHPATASPWRLPARGPPSPQRGGERHAQGPSQPPRPPRLFKLFRRAGRPPLVPVPVPEAGGRALRCAGERLPARCRRRRACALRSGVGGCASAGSAASNQRAGCVRGGAGAGGRGGGRVMLLGVT